MNNRLYVGNLSFNTTEDVIQEACAQHGEVVEVKLMLDRDTGRSRGFAFVTMGNGDAAQKAISSMNGTVLDGRQAQGPLPDERAEAPGHPEVDQRVDDVERLERHRPCLDHGG
jgi:RNA recognition motif-containing protein